VSALQRLEDARAHLAAASPGRAAARDNLERDYITDYVDPLDLGPLVLSLFGIAVMLLAFAVLQGYLANRIPLSRVRKRECPFCGYPVRGNQRCDGWGREVVASCAAWGADQRIGVLHCGACSTS
jgi:hypothetical protein